MCTGTNMFVHHHTNSENGVHPTKLVLWEGVKKHEFYVLLSSDERDLAENALKNAVGMIKHDLSFV